MEIPVRKGPTVWSIFPAYAVSFPLNCPAHIETNPPPSPPGRGSITEKCKVSCPAKSAVCRKTKGTPQIPSQGRWSQVPGLPPLTSSPSTGTFPEPSSSPSHWSHLCMSLPMSLMSLQCPLRSCWHQTQSLW